MAREHLAAVDEVPLGSVKRVRVGDISLCLAHMEDGGFSAIADECTHEGTSLSDGELVGTEVECPLHGSVFDTLTGAVKGPPATIPAKVYRVTVADNEVYLEL